MDNIFLFKNNRCCSNMDIYYLLIVAVPAPERPDLVGINIRINMLKDRCQALFTVAEKLHSLSPFSYPETEVFKEACYILYSVNSPIQIIKIFLIHSYSSFFKKKISFLFGSDKHGKVFLL